MEYRRIVNKAYDQGSYKSNTYFNLRNKNLLYLSKLKSYDTRLLCKIIDNSMLILGYFG